MRALIYNASAGSGKTYRLAYKYVKDVIIEPLRYRHILAVTFTNKATEEMKSRILLQIDALASPQKKSPYMEELKRELGYSEELIRRRALTARTLILHDYSRFTVLTIDTFFQRILRAFIHELGLDYNYNIELESSSLLAQSADAIVEDITSKAELHKWLLEFIEERIDQNKGWSITDGILALSREIEGESNSDTLHNAPSKDQLRQFVNAIQRLCRASHTQFQSVANEALSAIEAAGLELSEFKGKSRSIAHYFASAAKSDTPPPPSKSVREGAHSINSWATKGSPAESFSPTAMNQMERLLDIYDKNIKLWNTAPLIYENFRSFALLSDLYTRLKEVCDEQNIMLLSQTKTILSKFIQNNDAPFIFEKVGNRFERFMIDEFQDTSLKEWGNFLPLLQNAMSQSEDNSVLLVGDIKQSIYRWRGGDWRILHSEARQALGTEDTSVVSLQDNWRSMSNVVEFNNNIIDSIVNNENSYLNSTLEAALAQESITLPLKAELHDMLRSAYTDHKQIPRKGKAGDGFVEITTFTQTPPVIERIKGALDRGYRPCDILVLTRSKSQGVRIAAMLLEFKEQNRDERYRFDVMTQESLTVGYAPISGFVIANMSLAIDPTDKKQRAVYNHFLKRDGYDAELPESELLFLKSLRMMGIEEVFESITIHHDLSSRSDSIAYLQALHDLIINFSSSRISDLPLFIKWWNEKGANKSLTIERSDSAIEITTIHKAKGLERDVVIIPYCDWSLNPKSSGQSPSIVWAHGSQEAEELGLFPIRFKSTMGNSLYSKDYYREMVYSHIDNINLLYVALTRAAESLHIFIPNKSGKRKTEFKNNNVGDIILASITESGDEAAITELQGTTQHSEDGLSYLFGNQPMASTKENHSSQRLHIMDRYPTSKCNLQLRLPSKRYREDSDEFDARHEGILLHKCFESANTLEDILRSIKVMEQNGALTPHEAQSVELKVKESMKDPLVKEWFCHDWDTIRNEADIILPNSISTRRPDRVMIQGDRVVVVDYKFGELHTRSHQKQMCTYMSLMSQMGYNHVEGYIWYIKSGEVVEC